MSDHVDTCKTLAWWLENRQDNMRDEARAAPAYADALKALLDERERLIERWPMIDLDGELPDAGPVILHRSGTYFPGADPNRPCPSKAAAVLAALKPPA